MTMSNLLSTKFNVVVSILIQATYDKHKVPNGPFFHIVGHIITYNI